MRRFLVFAESRSIGIGPHGDSVELSPYSLDLPSAEEMANCDEVDWRYSPAREAAKSVMADAWERDDRWGGCIDVAYREFLLHNHLRDVDDFNDQALTGATIVTIPGQPPIDWSIAYGSDEHADCEHCARMVAHSRAHWAHTVKNSGVQAKVEEGGGFKIRD